MKLELCKYGREWALFCHITRCYVLFGKKKDLIKRLKELNNETK